MGTAKGMLAEARKSLGLGEPNHIQRWYADRNGAAYRYNFAWCAAAVTYWAYKSGNHKAVCPAGDRAYTVWFAQDYQKRGRWYSGTTENLKRAKPGDVVFFDWRGSNSIGAIDHVGVVEEVLGDGRVVCIEGNTGDACKRRVRSASSIAGYGRPDYDQEDDVPLSKDEIKAIADAVWERDVIPAPANASTVKTNPTWKAASHLSDMGMMLRLIYAEVSGRQPADVDEAAIVAGLLERLSPAAIADAVRAALPDDLARQVVDELGARLGS